MDRKSRAHILKVTSAFLTAVSLLLMVSGNATGGIQKQRFEQIIDLFQDLYGPEFQNRQHRLRIMGHWESERLEASARKDMDTEGQLAVITITGGLARHETITEGAFALVICHEIGHFLAGLPAHGIFSTEGQSDYFAASACMRQLIPHISAGNMSDTRGTPVLVRKQCGTSFADEWNRNICMQTAMAGFSLSHYFAHKQKIDTPRFESPDPNEVEVLGFGTQTVQCRLDTYIAAALCNPEIEGATYPDRHWLCSRSGERSYAARPRCWYPDSQ